MDNKKIETIYGSCRQEAFARVPGSKSITNRALLLAALADGKSHLSGAFVGGDFWDLMKALQTLGIRIEADAENRLVTVEGCGGRIQTTDEVIYVGSAGTAARFVTALMGTIPGVHKLDASEQMRKRPMAPLLDALKEMGCQVTCTGEEGHFPFTIEVPEKRNTEINIDINSSSQFLSALLIAGAVSPEGMTIHIKGKHGMAYVEMTEKMVRQFGVDIPELEGETYRISGGGKYRALNYEVEPDMSAACYFYAAAAILGAKAGVYGVKKPSLQGDMAFLDVLEKMGCEIGADNRGITVKGPEQGKLDGIEVDMHSFSDQALTLAAIAPFADTPVSIMNVGHIRGQECDRIMAIETNLKAIGIECQIQDGNITIIPGQMTGAVINPYGDHRVAMSFAVTGLRTEGISIDDPKCTKKTFEEYFDVLEKFVKKLTNE